MDRLDRFKGPLVREILRSGSSHETLAMGRKLGSIVPPGSVISLEGGLGAGKTLFAKGICAGLGVDEEVLSPSFILVEEYRGGDLTVLHFDLYRLERFDEVDDLGLFDAVDGKRIVMVEWGDRLPRGVFSFDIRVTMRIIGETEREIIIEACEELIDAFSRGTDQEGLGN